VLSNLFRVESAAGLFLSNVSERGVCVRDAVKEGEVSYLFLVSVCFCGLVILLVETRLY